MSHIGRGKGVIRKSFSKIKEVVSLPNLIEVQSKSFNNFTQLDCLPSERKHIGLEKVFRDTFPIKHNERISLEYVSYELGDWSCICGQTTGIQNRYKWQCTSCKKSGFGSLVDGNMCPSCGKTTASYTHCKKCFSRVTIKSQSPVDECRYSGKTYAMPLKVKLQLITWDVDQQTSARVIRDIKEQDVFFCDLPAMVDLYEDADGCFKLGSQGIFVINGVDRVVVSQIHRAPGVIFTLSKKTKDFRGQPYHIARIIPNRGSWLDFEFDHNDLLYVRIDKKKKILVTAFLQALGIEKRTILSLFYDFETIDVKGDKFLKKVDANLIGQRLEAGALPKDIEDQFTVGQRFIKATIDKLVKAGVTSLFVRKPALINKVLAEDIIDRETGEVLASQGTVVTEDVIDNVFNRCKSFKVIQSAGYTFQPSLALTFAQDHTAKYEDALKELYGKLKPGDIPNLSAMEEYVQNLFFNPRFYDLTIVGRIRSNRKLGLKVSESITHLTKEDIVATVKYLIMLKERGEGELDDIDHLGNRAVRLVGELLQSQLYVGFARLERIVKERFRLQENYVALMPYDFLNVKPLAAVLREFFGTGQLSQFMDQTNPLAEMAHKRRLSALGPGGITRERATFEVRDVHTSHYGRICPIETPEGQNIGLISSLSTYAKVNELGFIETPYRPVKNGVVQEKVNYLDAFQELGETIAQSTVPLDKNNKITDAKVLARKNGNILLVDAQSISYIDASPRQLFSVPTSLIPFLEHDDANRALMGSNMQRQSVPLIRCQAPMVGTGMELEVGSLEGAIIRAKAAGTVEYVSSEKIIVRIDDTKNTNSDSWFSKPIEVYTLKKFGRSSHNTWIHYNPIAKVGDKIQKGEVLADGAATRNGELALGNDVLVAFMPWQGYNFEDAVVMSKRLVADDVFTSVHVEEFIVEARETKLGAEEITRDIPNVSEKDLAALDEDGVVKIGTRVKPGDILTGKVTLKGDIQVSPEEKLLRAIFGEKSREVRDTSLRVPPGVDGTVIDVKIFSRSGIRKDKRYKEFVIKETTTIEETHAFHLSILRRGMKEKVLALLEKGKIKGKFENEDLEKLLEIKTKNKTLDTQLDHYKEVYTNQIHVLAALKEDRINQLRKGDELPSGVIKMIKVYVANKRRVSVGDKVAGRHGNKGVVSRIVNIEDMPYLEDGQAVDVVLNPLGVPGRMNLGQILETILGMAGNEMGRQFAEKIVDLSYADIKPKLAEFYTKELVDELEKTYGKDEVIALAKQTATHGVSIKTPIFAGADYAQEIQPLLESLKLPKNGTYKLFDGRSGEAFDQPVTVGRIYMMKLNHLADDKLHARSVGPYSLITQQPLGGKAQFGGQRLGEMEVWALYAYGAAYTLQEMLTLKSDDVNGRIKAYEAIVRGDEVPEAGVPESFNVLVKELQSLGLEVDLLKTSKEQFGE